MLQFLLLTILVISGAMNYAFCTEVKCGNCTVDDAVKTCGTASATAAYCVYKIGSDCAVAADKKTLLAKLKLQVNCPASVTKTCQCQKAFIEVDPPTCTTREALVPCVYKETDAGCGGAAEDNAAARKYATGVLKAGTGCKALSATCMCEDAYYALSGDACTNAKTFVDCVTKVNPQTDKACDGTKTAATIKTEAEKEQTAKCRAGCLGYPLAAMFAVILGLLVKNK